MAGPGENAAAASTAVAGEMSLETRKTASEVIVGIIVGGPVTGGVRALVAEEIAGRVAESATARLVQMSMEKGISQVERIMEGWSRSPAGRELLGRVEGIASRMERLSPEHSTAVSNVQDAAGFWCSVCR